MSQKSSNNKKELETAAQQFAEILVALLESRNETKKGNLKANKHKHEGKQERH